MDVNDSQMMEGRGEQKDEQANAASDENARRIADDPGEGDASQRRAVEDQAQRRLSACESIQIDEIMAGDQDARTSQEEHQMQSSF